MRDQFPDVTFNFENYGIGGTTIQNAVDPNYVPPTDFSTSWPGINGKAWRDYVKDSQPDLLIVNFGMNPISDISQVGYYLELLRLFINTWDKIPAVVFTTNYLPNQDWTGSDGRLQRLHHMRTTRYWAKSRGYSIIDIGANYRRLVDGIDENGYAPQKYLNFEHFTGDSIKTSDFMVKNFILQFDTTFTSATNFSIKFGKFSELKISGTSISLYINGWLAKPSMSVSIPNNTYTVTVQRIDEKLTINVGSVSVTIDAFGDFYDGYISIQKVNEDFDLINFSCVAYFNTLSKPLLTVEDTLGKYVENDTSMKYPFGGNGVNHPTTKNIEFVFKPEIDKFIDGVKFILTKKLTASFYAPPKRINTTDFRNVATTDWGTNGGLNDSGLQLKFYALGSTVDNVSSGCVRRLTDGSYLTYKSLTQQNVNQLNTGEFTIILSSGVFYLILVNPAESYDFYEFKDIVISQ